MTDYEKVTSFESLYIAYKKAKAGRGTKSSATKFSTMALEGVLLLKQRLEDKSYQVSPYHEFKVYEPKERLIRAGSFQDKVVQHSLCDNVLLPLFEHEFIYDNYAGQIDKGTLLGLDRLSFFMKSYYHDYGLSGYILKCDITKFFYTIDHEILKDMISYHVTDPDIVWLCDQFIDSTEGPGIPLGNQVSQVFALLYLNGLDHFIHDELGIVYYGRYMDDFYLIHHDRQYLKYCLEAIKAFVESLKLSLNDKTQIIPLKNGLKFLGFHTYINERGDVIRKLKNENKRNAMKKLRKMARLVGAGKLERVKFDESYSAWRNHAGHGDCGELITKLDSELSAILGKREEGI